MRCRCSEVAERFDLTEDEVVGDLELAAMCGLPPFVDELIDVFIDEGMIFVGVPRLFTRPLRLNSVEAFELLAAARAAMELPGADPDGALARGLAKLATALGEDDTAGVKVELDAPRARRSAGDGGDRASSSSASSTSAPLATRRPVVGSSRVRCSPIAASGTSAPTTSARGRCARSGSTGSSSVEPTGAIVEPSSEPVPVPGAWFADASVPRAVVRLSPAAQWVVERFPVDAVEGPDARWLVDGHVAGRQ